MKKIYSTLALSAIFFGAFAQQLPKVQMNANSITNAAWLNSNGSNAKTASTSTLMPATMMGSGCGTNTANVVYYSNFGSAATANYTVSAVGYAYGTNKATYVLSTAAAAQIGTPTITVENNRAAQKYNVTGNVTVTDVLVATAKGEGTGSISAKIYSENVTTKGPNAQVGVTATKALSTITGYDALTFSTPVPVSAGNFFASIESPTIGGAGMDTLAILSTMGGCSSTDSLSWYFSNVTPASAGAVLGAGWSSVMAGVPADNLDFLIFPVVNITTGLNSISKGNLTLLAAFPNPAASEITINFGLNQSSKVEIEIYDVTGKIVNSIKLDNLEAGNHSSNVNTSNLNAGVYMYSVKSENAKMFSKFTVAK